MTVKCNGRLQRGARFEEGDPKRRSTMDMEGELNKRRSTMEGELKRRSTMDMEAREKLPTYSVNTSAASLISSSSVVEEVEAGRRRGEESLDLRSQYTTSPKSGWI